MSSFPAHQVLRLPALSPTMEKGTLASWSLKEGDAVEAGDVLAEIETDKASVDFEATDDGFLAKILVDAGASDVPVGTPIGVIAEDEGDIAAFASFTAADAGEASASAPAPAPKAASPPPPPPPPTPTPPPPQPKPAAPSAPAPAPTPAPAAAPAPKPAPTPAPTAAPAPTPAPKPAATAAASGRGPTGPLASMLTKQQAAYELLYGPTLMRPVESKAQ